MLGVSEVDSGNAGENVPINSTSEPHHFWYATEGCEAMTGAQLIWRQDKGYNDEILAMLGNDSSIGMFCPLITG